MRDIGGPDMQEFGTTTGVFECRRQCSLANTRFREPDTSVLRTLGLVIDITRIQCKTAGGLADLVLECVVNGIASARDERKNAMNQLLADLRYALRQLRRAPGFALTAVLTLALGIGANSTILSWISATLFNPIPEAKNIDRMLTIQRGERSEHPSPPFSYPDFVDLRENTRSFSGMIGYHDDYISITGSAKPERIYGALTSADYFEVLGVQPYLGRTLISTKGNERAGAAIVVLSYDLWQNHFAGDPGIIGKTIQLNLHPYTIVGIAPKGFRGCKSGLRTDIFLPLAADGSDMGQQPDRQSWRRLAQRSGCASARRRSAPGRQRTEPADAAHLLRSIRRNIGERIRSPPIRCGVRRSAPMSTWPVPFQFCWRWPRYCCFLPAPMLPTCCWFARWRGVGSLRFACRWVPAAGCWCGS